LEGEAGVKPRSPKGGAVARGLDARIHFQHPFIPAGDTPPKSHQPIKIPLTVITVSTATHGSQRLGRLFALSHSPHRRKVLGFSNRKWRHFLREHRTMSSTLLTSREATKTIKSGPQDVAKADGDVIKSTGHHQHRAVESRRTRSNEQVHVGGGSKSTHQANRHGHY